MLFNTNRLATVGTWMRQKLRLPTERSLVGRVLTLSLIAAVCIYLIAIAGLWWTGGRMVQDSLKKQAAHWRTVLDDLGTPLYVARGFAAAQQQLAARLRKFPEIGFVRYYDATGKKIMWEYTRIANVPSLSPGHIKRAAARVSTAEPYLVTDTSDDAYVRVIAPIRVKSFASDGLLDFDLARVESIKVIGYLDFGLDPGYHRADFQRSMVIGTVAIAIVFLIAVMIARRFVKKALSPLTELQEPLTRLARGDTDVTVSVTGAREITAISKALNTTISALRQKDQELLRAEYDAITGLVNRAHFYRQLELERKRVALEGETSAMLFIDLDNFKQVNDALGHAAGDRLLAQVAGLLRAHIRDNDVLSRFSADEFAVLARRANRDGATKVARSINQVMQEFQFVEAEQSFRISCSTGIVLIDSDRFTTEEIISQGANARYDAKARGGNCYSIHESSSVAEERQPGDLGWSQRIREAIREHRFRLVYQPIVSLKRDGGNSQAYEALLRLVGDQGELIAPAAFLPIANRFGLLVEIDYWVIRNALQALAGFRRTRPDMVFFINLSGQVFEQGDALFRVVKEGLEQHRLPGSAVIFEITEQVAVRYINQARSVMEGVKSLQCRFALDDFGSGFSSLSYLKHLPVSFIKIDGAFVQNIAGDRLDEVMVKSIIQIARTLNKETIAESVQDRPTLDLLAKLGADYVQGHYLGRPAEEPQIVPAIEVERPNTVKDFRPLVVSTSKRNPKPR